MRKESCSEKELERRVRQLLCNKISGNLVGLWLLIPEYLRLGLWDLLRGFSACSDSELPARLTLQLVNEAALGINGKRHQRTLSQKGFEVAHGLPFVVTDVAVHELLNARCMEDSIALQIALGKIRRTFGHFHGQVLAADPHRLRSCSKRQMVRLCKDPHSKPAKVAQTFFLLDVKTSQPLCFTTASSAFTVTQATPLLMRIAAAILEGQKERPLVLADDEHYTTALFDHVKTEGIFDLLAPMPSQAYIVDPIKNIPYEQFTRHWAGYATTKRPYGLKESRCGPYHQFIQREGEDPDQCHFKAFLCTSDRDELEAMTEDYPDRWHIEPFFKNDQDLGWKVAGTRNLHIRFGKMTLALAAQAACAMLRERLGPPHQSWDAAHLARDLFGGLDGDIRVCDDTIVVTYYNAPNRHRLRKHYENLPEKLQAEGINPSVPWLYGLKLDFRFK